MFILQCAKLKELITEVKDKLSKKDDIEPEEIRKSTTQLQQASLKLFEMAYKKVGNWSIYFVNIKHLKGDLSSLWLILKRRCPFPQIK